jgi:hypothetical protein
MPARRLRQPGEFALRGRGRPWHEDSGRAAHPAGIDAVTFERLDDRLLDAEDELLDENPAAPQIDERICDDLARPVECHLSAAIGGDDRDLTGAAQMLAAARLAKRVYRRVLDQPQLVLRACIALLGEVPHRLPGWHVLGAAEVAHDHRFRPAIDQRTTFTIG